MTASEEWISHVERCDSCAPHASLCPEGERLLAVAATTTALRMTGLLIDLGQSKGDA